MKLDNPEDRNLHFMDAYQDGIYRYFSAIDCNGLFRMQIGKESAEFLCFFPDEDLNQKYLHRRVFFYKSKLYFTPYRGRGISVYDLSTNEMRFYPILDGKAGVCYLSQAHLIENRILLLPENQSIPFQLFHMEDNTYELQENVWSNITDCLKDCEEILFDSCSSVILDNQLILSVWNTNHILSVELSSEKVNKHTIPEQYRLRNLWFDGTYFWCTLLNGYRILRCSKTFGEITEYQQEKNGECIRPYMTVLGAGDKTIVLPCTENKLMVAEDETEKLLELDSKNSDGFIRNDPKMSVFLGYEITENQELVLYPCGCNGLVHIDLRTFQIVTDPLVYSEEFLPHLYDIIKVSKLAEDLDQYKVIIEHNEPFHELENYIKYVMHSNPKNSIEEKKTCGEVIWDFLK
jgi:hypothetical protein